MPGNTGRPALDGVAFHKHRTDINVEQSSSLHGQSLTMLWRLFTEQNIAVPSEDVWLITFKLWSAEVALVMNQNGCMLSDALSFSCSRTHFRHRPPALGLLLLIKAVRCACASSASLPNLSPASPQSSFLKRRHSKHSELAFCFTGILSVCAAQFAKWHTAQSHSPLFFTLSVSFLFLLNLCLSFQTPLQDVLKGFWGVSCTYVVKGAVSNF